LDQLNSLYSGTVREFLKTDLFITWHAPKYFARLVDLANSLDAEQRRAAEEGLNEEELALFDLLFRQNISRKDREMHKQASKILLLSLRELIKPMPTWTQNVQTQAEVRMFVLDILWEKLPRPTFFEEDAEFLTDRVYDYVWQRSATGDFLNAGMAA
jgi:type I restriction enzyme R subunit